MIHVFCNLEPEDEDGQLPLCDMTFEIVESRFEEDGGEWTLRCRADAGSAGIVGFDVRIPTGGWDEQVDGEGDEEFHSYWGPAWLRSCGAESDALLALISDYFAIPRSDGEPLEMKFASEIECLTVGIDNDPSIIAAEPIRMKLFFDQGTEDGRYAEYFFNVDMPAGLAALNEKDEEYRAGFVHWLSLPGPVDANPYSSARSVA